MDARKWSNLPIDLLNQIAKRLEPGFVDIRRFRAVCSSWRSSVPCPKKFLIEVPFPIKSTSEPKPIRSLLLTQRTLFLLSPLITGGDNITDPPIPWVIPVKESGPGKWSLLGPNYAGDRRTLSQMF